MASANRSSYPSLLSLSRAIHRVELLGALACVGILAHSPGIPAAYQEPEPRPQIQALGSDYREAQDLISKKKWVEAAIVLRKIHKEEPEFVPAAVDLARALVYSGRREEALSVLTQAAGREKGSRKQVLLRRASVISRLFLTKEASHTFQEGMNLMLAKKYRQAKDSFEKILEVEPDNVEILTRLGQALILLGDMDSAAERLRLARRLNMHEPEVQLWLGRALHQRGEITEALTHLKSALQGLPGSELAPLWYAEALVSSNQRPAALQVLEYDLKTQPMHIRSIVQLARLRFQAPIRDPQALWTVRKDLQVALSRYPRYISPESVGFESDLGLDLREPNDLKSEIEGLLQKVDFRIEKKAEST